MEGIQPFPAYIFDGGRVAEIAGRHQEDVKVVGVGEGEVREDTGGGQQASAAIGPGGG